jgi:hypothetical protein
MVAVARPQRDDRLRDAVATRMLPLCSQWTLIVMNTNSGPQTQHNPHAAAHLAYGYADAMLEAREAR